MEKAWNELGLSDELLKLIENAGYRAPTPVQAEAIPLALAGEDIIASSQTGSGKTATFVLPTVDRFKGKEGTFILILAPTREIAQQTHQVIETFGAPLGIRSIVLIGGIHMSLDKKALDSYPQVIVATPGRLCDHLDRGNIWLDFIKVLILDEADRMLDMGFADQLSRIMQDIPAERQTMVFSATYGPSVTKLVDRIMTDPKRVTIGETSSTPKKITQKVIFLQEEEKMSALMRIIREETGTIIIFTRSKDRASRVWRSLHSRTVYDATYIHSDCTQSHRETAMADFKAGKYRILVATDVAGRGIDVDDIAHVVNYDLSMEPEDYVHRIGRTGRRGKEGLATTLATHRDRDILRRIEKLVGASLGLGDRPAQSDRPQGGEGRDGGRRGESRESGRGGDRGGRSSGSRRGQGGGQDRPQPSSGERPKPSSNPQKLIAQVGAPSSAAPAGRPATARATDADSGPDNDVSEVASGVEGDEKGPSRSSRRRRGRRGPRKAGEAQSEGQGGNSTPTSES